MFSTHTITSRAPKARNLILLFVSIVLWLGSVIVRAADSISIDTNITNAIQTIMKIVVTSNGTQWGTTGLVIDGWVGGGIIITGGIVTDGLVSKILGIDTNGKVFTTGADGLGGGGIGSTWDIYNLINNYFNDVTNNNYTYITGGAITNITNILNSIVNDNYRTGNGANIYNTNTGKNVNIWGGAAGTYSGRLEVNSTGGTTVYLEDSTASGSNIVFKDSSTTGRMLLGNGTNFYIGTSIWASTNPYLRVYGNGTVGIWTSTTPVTNAKLEVSGNIKLSSAGWIGATGNQISFDTTANKYNVAIGTGASAGGTDDAKLEVNGNIRLSSKGWIGTKSNQIYLTTGGNIGINDWNPKELLSVAGNISSNGSLIFQNSASISCTGRANQIYLDDNGRVGINTNSPTQSLTVSGNIQMKSGNRIWSATGNRIYFVNTTTGGRIGIGRSNPLYTLDVTSGAVMADVYYTSSDKRLKTNITVMNDALDKILSLNGYYFSFKKNGIKSFWVIAQEMEKVFPEIVNTADDGFKAVNYSNLVAPLIEAVKALNAKITQVWNLYFDQQQQINQLEQRIETLENKLP